ncbi:MAG: WXG100 family type VII secretion target [Anaerolineae bacterium]|nr:WXG100 family type VII secretion target [Anaerolineae bacterium]
MRGIRVEYDSLQEVERTLRRHAESVQDALWQIRHQVGALQSGGWLGEAADAFYDEVEAVVYSHLKRLNDEFDDTAKGVKIVGNLFDDAELTIRPLFGAGGGSYLNFQSAPQGTPAGGGSNEIKMNDSAGGSQGGSTGAGGAGFGGFAALNPQGFGGGAGLTFGGAGGASAGVGGTGSGTGAGARSGGGGGGGASTTLNTGFRSNWAQIDGVLQAHGIKLPPMVSAMMQVVMVEPGVAPLAIPAGDSPEAKLAANPRFQAVLHAIYNNPNDPDGYMELALILDKAGFREQAIQSYRAFINLSNPESWSYTDVTTAQARIAALS